jgi:hypothetical protein
MTWRFERTSDLTGLLGRIDRVDVVTYWALVASEEAVCKTGIAWPVNGDKSI